jgi:hypothetical protein
MAAGELKGIQNKRGDIKMRVLQFNAITYANRLKKALDKNEMADIQAEELSNLINNDLATKQDLLNLKNEMIIKLAAITVSCTMATIGFLAFFIRG